MTEPLKAISPEEFSQALQDLLAGVDVGVIVTEMIHVLAGCYNLCVMNNAPEAVADMRGMLQGLLNAIDERAAARFAPMPAAPVGDNDDAEEPPGLLPVLH